MKVKLVTHVLLLSVAMASCNDEVFVSRPPEVIPPEENPEPEPENKDSLVLQSLTYGIGTLNVEPVGESISETIFNNNCDKPIKVYVLYDNYNNSLVRISNSTYYVIPWKKEQPNIQIPGIGSYGLPYFDDTEIPFKFGITSVPRQYMPGHTESFELPPSTMIRAYIYVNRKVVTAKADIVYYISDFPDSLSENWVDVSVLVPVEIRVEWGKIMPIQ